MNLIKLVILILVGYKIQEESLKEIDPDYHYHKKARAI